MPWLFFISFLNPMSGFFVKHYKIAHTVYLGSGLNVVKTLWTNNVNQDIASFCSAKVSHSTNSQVVSSRHQTDTSSTHPSTSPTPP